MGGEGQLKQHCDFDNGGANNYDYRGANDFDNGGTNNYDYRGANNYDNDDSNDHDHDHESTDHNHDRSRRCREAWSATFDRRSPGVCEL